MNDFNLFEHIQGIQDQCVGDDGKFDETKLDEITLHSRHVGKLKRYDEVGMEIENGFTKAEELMGCPVGYLNNKPYGKGIKLSIQSTLAGGRQYEIETEKQVELLRESKLAFKEGAEGGCIPSMFRYGTLLEVGVEDDKVHVAVPWYIEGAIRGHLPSIHALANVYLVAKPTAAPALSYYWMKIVHNKNGTIKFNNVRNTITGTLRSMKQEHGKSCFVCGAVPSQSDGTTGQESKLYCGQCKFYCYCSRQCQTEHWVNLGHKGECKHLGLLKKYHEPYARDIRDAFVYKGKSNNGSNKKKGKRNKRVGKSTKAAAAAVATTDRRNTIVPELDELRTRLGLTRPIEDYAPYLDLAVHWEDDHRYKSPMGDLQTMVRAVGDPRSGSATTTKPHKLLVARNDGTVHVGSIPDML